MKWHVEQVAGIVWACFLFVVTVVDAAANEPRGVTKKKLIDDPISCEICIGDCNSINTIAQQCPQDFPDSCAAVYSRNGDVLAKGCSRKKTHGCAHYHSEIFQLGRQMPDDASIDWQGATSVNPENAPFIACYCDRSDECNRELKSYDQVSLPLSATSVRGHHALPSSSAGNGGSRSAAPTFSPFFLMGYLFLCQFVMRDCRFFRVFNSLLSFRNSS